MKRALFAVVAALVLTPAFADNQASTTTTTTDTTVVTTTMTPDQCKKAMGDCKDDKCKADLMAKGCVAN